MEKRPTDRGTDSWGETEKLKKTKKWRERVIKETVTERKREMNRDRGTEKRK